MNRKDFFAKAQDLEGFYAFSPEIAHEDDGFDSEAFKKLIKVEENYFWFKERNNLIIWAIKKLCPNISNFLEIGCGTGYVSKGIQKEFPHLDHWGSEIFLEGLKHAATRLDPKKIFQLDARKIPFKEKFDAVGMFDVLEHITEDEQVLEQVHKSLKPGGRILLTVPQHMFLWSITDDIACHKRRYSKKELLDKLKAAGFTIEKSSSFMAFLLPLVFLARSKKDKSHDPIKEFKIPAILNLVFSWVLKFENLLIRLGLSLPFGSSLLVVAKK